MSDRDDTTTIFGAPVARGGQLATMSLEDTVKLAMERVNARWAAEAAELGITEDELHRRRADEAAAQERSESQARACSLRAARLARHPLGLTPEMAQAITAGTLPTSPALRVCKRWLANPKAPPILVLCGGTGTSKTVTAGWALAERDGDYVRALDLAERHRPQFEERERFEALHVKRARLLVLDDLGTEKLNAKGERDSRFLPALYDVIDQRNAVMVHGEWVQLLTLITTNLGEEAFMKTYAPERRHDSDTDGERIRSRLRQSAFFFSTGNVDLRRAR